MTITEKLGLLLCIVVLTSWDNQFGIVEYIFYALTTGLFFFGKEIDGLWKRNHTG